MSQLIFIFLMFEFYLSCLFIYLIYLSYTFIYLFIYLFIFLFSAVRRPFPYFTDTLKKAQYRNTVNPHAPPPPSLEIMLYNVVDIFLGLSSGFLPVGLLPRVCGKAFA